MKDNRKASTRPPERRGMSKSQIREERRLRSKIRARRKRSILMFFGILLAVLFIASLVLSPNTNSKDINPKGINTAGHISIDPNDGRKELEIGVGFDGEYSTNPPTSGPHWNGSETPFGIPSPARWGVYDYEIIPEILIQNLEVGGIGIHYYCPEGCNNIVSQLNDLIPVDSSQYIMSPHSYMPKKIAITAWRHHILLDNVDIEKIKLFIEEYQDRAPQTIKYNLY
ncbi:MAG: DUF3105 domain-containing protein [Dehalococcoidia bacterium]